MPSARCAGFERFPTWMWRNADVLDFVGWLRAAQRRRTAAPAQGRLLRARSLQPRSLHRGSRSTYLDRVDPTPPRARARRYACFDRFDGESAAYGYAAGSGVSEPCRGAVVEQLLELQRRAGDYLRRDGLAAEDEQFSCRAERPAGAERRGVLPHDVRAAGHVLEPARPAHGRHARPRSLAHLGRHGGGAGRGVGAQLPCRRRARDRDGRA